MCTRNYITLHVRVLRIAPVGMAQLAQLVIGMLEFTSVKSRVYRGSVAERGYAGPGRTGGCGMCTFPCIIALCLFGWLWGWVVSKRDSDDDDDTCVDRSLLGRIIETAHKPHTNVPAHTHTHTHK